MFSEQEPLSSLKGIGQKTYEKFNEIGIYSVIDLLNFFPKTYKNRTYNQDIAQVKNAEKVLVKATYQRFGTTAFARKNFSRSTAYFKNECCEFKVVFYNKPYVKTELKLNEEYFLYGTVTNKDGAICLISPQIETAKDNAYLKEGMYPIYPIPSKSKLGQKLISKYISKVLNSINFSYDVLDSLISNSEIIDRKTSYNYIHKPTSISEIDKAMERFKLKDFLVFFTMIEQKSGKLQNDNGIVFSDCDISEFTNHFAFELTDAQQKAVADIVSDVKSKKRMNRLIEGDVGSGKTAVATTALYLSIKNGYQAVISAPTQILAKQHYQKYESIFRELGYESVLLHSSMKASSRREALMKIRSGKASVIFGTHAVFSDDVIYHNLALIVIDEQHRYGVGQRAKLENKGNYPHVLIMSATPIPRTLALTYFKDVDISILDSKPSGRIPVKTSLINSSSLKKVYGAIKLNALRGEKTFIVCPSIEDDELENVKNELEQVKKYIHPIKAISLTGEMSEEEKNKRMDEFAFGNAMVLVATTVVEVGIDVSVATIILIKGSERFGLSQLHQLRGRVGRSELASHCILHTDSESENAIKRLRVLTSTDDGFRIAQEDLKNRGHGEIYGLRQSGKNYSLIDDILFYENLYIQAEKLYNDIKLDKNKCIVTYFEELKEEARRKYIELVLN